MRFATKLPCVNHDEALYYPRQGPLTKEEMQALEPLAQLHDDDDDDDDEDNGSKSNKNHSSSTFTYYFPDEGLVDPTEAVRVLRHEATQRGVQFMAGSHVTGLVVRDDSAIGGVTVEQGIPKDDQEQQDEYEQAKDVMTKTIYADIVVVAAGMGCQTLANIPLLHSPGRVALARCRTNSDDGNNDTTTRCNLRLSRILVDTVRESHVLQRRDGTWVVGGGALQVGGSEYSRKAVEIKGTAAATNATSTAVCMHNNNHVLLQGAEQVVPHLRRLEWDQEVRVESALRPIPQDGLPAVGLVQPGLYTVVSHSGVTLAPILGALVAEELLTGRKVSLLESFRPDRFF